MERTSPERLQKLIDEYPKLIQPEKLLFDLAFDLRDTRTRLALAEKVVEAAKAYREKLLSKDALSGIQYISDSNALGLELDAAIAEWEGGK